MKNRRFLIILFIALSFGFLCGEFSVKVEAKKRTFTVNPKTIPCNKTYRSKSVCNAKTKQYCMIQSYLERLAFTGGTLKLKKGTYKIPATLYVPSNVTIELKSGAKLKKTTATGSGQIKASKYMIQTISPAKVTKKRGTGKYEASKKVTIKGGNKAVFDLGNVKGATGIYIGHASNIVIKGITFKNKKGGSYIWLEGSQNVTISKCSFLKGKNVSGLKNRMAIRLENINETTNDFTGTWSKLDNTKNRKIIIQENQFKSADIGIGTTKSVVIKTSKSTPYYQSGIKIQENVFSDTKKCAIYAVLWKKPSVKKNIAQLSKLTKKTSSFLYGYGVTNPCVKNNKVSKCVYFAMFSKAKNTGKGKKMPSVLSELGNESVRKIMVNTVDDLGHYYVKNGAIRILYISNKVDKAFTLTPSSMPYHEKYTDASDYAKRKVYYIFTSYMEQLEYAGGGTITVKAGNYAVTNNICIPSNVTMTMENGVTFTKSGTTATDICYAKSIFTLVPPSKDGTIKTVSGYKGTNNVKIIGQGIVRWNCANVKNCMALVMGHAKNILVQGITFQNEYGSHFVELNSSNLVTFQNCTFEGFRVLDKKSHKECINIDGNDLVTDGFNYDWSSHEKLTCKNIYIKNNIFKNIGTAIGSHTYSSAGGVQLYHQNVQILNNTIEGTYNAAIRALNWKDTVVRGNIFSRIQSFDDGNGSKYVAVYLRGVVNPTITANTFMQCHYYPIRVVLCTKATTEAAIKAGYPDTISSLSEANWLAMLNNNKLEDVETKYHKIIVRTNSANKDAASEKKPMAE